MVDSGATTFAKTVGAGPSDQLGTLTTSAGGTGVSLGGNVTTGTTQTYNDPVTLTGSDPGQLVFPMILRPCHTTTGDWRG